jgi:hypothetical protein
MWKIELQHICLEMYNLTIFIQKWTGGGMTQNVCGYN